MPHTYLKSYGVRLDVEVEDESLQPAVDLILPPGWERSEDFPEDGHFTLSGRADGAYTVLTDGALVGTGLATDVAVHVLDAQVRMRIATLAKDRVFVHAGVVALGERALLLPGSSFCGKSTLVAALVSEGATYYSDEFAVLDESGSVYPYPRRLSLRQDGRGYGDYVSAEQLGGRAGSRPVRPALIAVTAYTPGEQWNPERHGPGLGALFLLTNTVPAKRRSEASVRAVSRAVESAQVLKGNRGEAREAAEALIVALAR